MYRQQASSVIRTYSLLVILLAVATTCFGQAEPPDIKFRIAQSYERSGDYASAVKMYEELYAKDSSNIVLFDALQKMYLQLKRYDEAVGLFQRRVAKYPADINLLAQLGIIYSRKGDDRSATSTWDRAIALSPGSETSYRLVAGAMMEARQFDKAIDVYRRGRTALNNQSIFANDLAYIYAMMLKYDDATREYLGLLRQNDAQLGYVQSRIAAYTGRSEGLAAATLVVQKAATSEPDKVSFARLLGWLYMEAKDFASAFDVYKSLDTRLHAGGHELHGFAERALREKAYAVASKAFLEVEHSYPSFEQMPMIRFGYARTLEEAASDQDTMHLFGPVSPFQPRQPISESQPVSTGVVAAYERVIKDYPGTELAAQSLYRIGVVKFNRSFDLDGAKDALDRLIRDYPKYATARADATLLLGDVLVARGDLDGAAQDFALLAAQLPASTEQKNLASLRLAEIDYFRGQFKGALERLSILTKNASFDVTNDALSLQIFIQENLNADQKPLTDFADADLLKRQRKLSEALAKFQSIIQSYPRSGIVDEAIMESGDLQARLGLYPEAVASYNRLVKDYPESLVLDRAVMKIGEVCEWGLHDNAQAIEAFKKLLTDYPRSIFAGEARKRIRELRGDNI